MGQLLREFAGLVVSFLTLSLKVQTHAHTVHTQCTHSTHSALSTPLTNIRSGWTNLTAGMRSLITRSMARSVAQVVVGSGLIASAVFYVYGQLNGSGDLHRHFSAYVCCLPCLLFRGLHFWARHATNFRDNISNDREQSGAGTSCAVIPASGTADPNF